MDKMKQKKYKRETFESHWDQKTKSAYTRAKAQARHRKVEWRLTIDDWYDIWERSGLWDQRGRVLGTYYMRRIDDEGPFTVDNLEITKNYKIWNKKNAN